MKSSSPHNVTACNMPPADRVAAPAGHHFCFHRKQLRPIYTVCQWWRRQCVTPPLPSPRPKPPTHHHLTAVPSCTSSPPLTPQFDTSAPHPTLRHLRFDAFFRPAADINYVALSRKKKISPTPQTCVKRSRCTAEAWSWPT